MSWPPACLSCFDRGVIRWHVGGDVVERPCPCRDDASDLAFCVHVRTLAQYCARCHGATGNVGDRVAPTPRRPWEPT